MQEQALVIDGDQAGSDFLVDTLRAGGYVAHAVSSAAEARAALQQQAFDVILLDLALPDADGLHLCYELRERLGTQVVIVVVSAQSTPSTRVVALEVGADDFVAKPFAADELLARIEAHLRRRRALGSE
jgi:two-component system OmpR family response regulator